MSTVKYREGTLEDSRRVFDISEIAFEDYYARIGLREDTASTSVVPSVDKAALDDQWDRNRSMFEHLASTADQFWVAERDGDLIGYARSILRGGLQELTEFFVLPQEQSAGVGGQLLSRVFPRSDASHWAIVATLENGALIQYLNAGVLSRFLIKYFAREPQRVEVSTDLEIMEMNWSPENAAIVSEIDKAVLGYDRPIDHEWILTERDGFLYRRKGDVVGYGYAGQRNGPFALLDSDDYPAVLSHAEELAHENGWKRFGVWLPLTNRAALDHVLVEGFRMDAFSLLFMSDQEFGQLDHYVLYSPPYFM